MLIGLYKNKNLFKTFSCEEQTSKILPKIFKEIDKTYNIGSIYYAKGPGSFMSIKVSYIFLKSYCIVKNIPLKAVDGFYFNQNNPIKAIGKMYFIKENNNIVLDTITPTNNVKFKLPKKLESQDFSSNNLPLYILPAV